ncbi:AMP-binding protein [Streptomyces sp. NPDC097107]|uniref:AMP-binding protein n=1 Tax=Streptomyces sp. NPDC097107 TaxID=3366089 RepID=UPI00380CBF55
MTSATDRFEAYFDQWLRVLQNGSPPGAGPGSAAPVRYAEWEGPDGTTYPVRAPRLEWTEHQIDTAAALADVVTPDDVVVVAAPYELSLAGAAVERAVELLGAAIVSVGTSNTICPVPRLLDLVHRYRVTVLVGPPQLAAELAALDEAAGRRPAVSSVTTLVATRPAAPERLRRIAAAWGATATGLFGTPSRPAAAAPCRHGGLHLAADRFRARLRDPAPGRLGAGGTRGELVLEPLRPGGFAPEETTGELVELPAAPCACGSTRPLAVPLGRVADTVLSAAGPVTQVDVEELLFTSPHPRGRVTARAEDGRLLVACDLGARGERHLGALRRLVGERFGPAVELRPPAHAPERTTGPERDPAEGDTRTRSS